MTEFENNGLGEPPIDPQQDHRSIRDIATDIASFPDFSWRQTRLIRYGATALAVLAGSGIYSNHVNADQAPSATGTGLVEALTVLAPSSNPPNNADQAPASAGTGAEVACASPTPQALKATTALFNTEPYSLSHAPAAYDHARVIVNPSANFISLPDATVATHYGLLVPTYDNQLFRAFESPRQVSPQPAIEETEAYLGKFGVQVVIGGSLPGELDGFTTPTQAEIDQDEVEALGKIDWDIQESPTAYIHSSGLKKIILTSLSSDSEGFYWTDPHTLVWNMSQPSYEGEMNQAVYEGINATECGFDNTTDPNYAALNRHNIYGSPKNDKGYLSEDHLILQQPTKEEHKLSNAIHAAYNDLETDAHGFYVTGADGNLIYKDPRRICRLLKDYNIGVVSRIAVEHHADFSSIEQDKDDLGAQFNWDANGYNEFLDPSSPILRRKALFLLARLYEIDPAIVEYFAGFSGRPHTLGGVVDCTKYGFSQPKIYEEG
jgi:hypothetical protein